MKIRFHAWMTRSLNGQRFTPGEHALYAACAIGLGVCVIGALVLAVARPSIGTLVLAMIAAVGAWWVMASTPKPPAASGADNQSRP